MTLPSECGPRSQCPQGLEGGSCPPPPNAWRLEPGATSDAHQHQARPRLRPGEPTPGSISGPSPPSSWWGATCSLYRTPLLLQQENRVPGQPLWPPLCRYHHRVHGMLSAGLGCLARGHQVPSSPELLTWKSLCQPHCPQPQAWDQDRKILAFQPQILHSCPVWADHGRVPVQGHTAATFLS